MFVTPMSHPQKVVAQPTKGRSNPPKLCLTSPDLKCMQLVNKGIYANEKISLTNKNCDTSAAAAELAEITKITKFYK